MRRLAIFVVCLVLGSCAAMTGGPRFSEAAPRDDKALIYIYRTAAITLGVRSAAFHLDDRKFVELLPTDYTSIYVTPGRHILKQDWPKFLGMQGELTGEISIKLDVQAGRTYYVRFETSSSSAGYNMTRTEWVMQRVPLETGLRELPSTHFQKPDAVADSF